MDYERLDYVSNKGELTIRYSGRVAFYQRWPDLCRLWSGFSIPQSFVVRIQPNFIVDDDEICSTTKSFNLHYYKL